jgi:hypothetical protein
MVCAKVLGKCETYSAVRCSGFLTYTFFEIIRRTQTCEHFVSVSLPRGSTDPIVPSPKLQVWGSSITPRYTTPGRNPLDEWSARCRDPYLTHNTHNGQISVLPHGIQTRNPGIRVTADPHIRPRGHRLPCMCFSLIRFVFIKVKVKVTLSLYTARRRTEGVVVYFHFFLSSAPDKGIGSASRLGRFIPETDLLVPIKYTAMGASKGVGV